MGQRSVWAAASTGIWVVGVEWGQCAEKELQNPVLGLEYLGEYQEAHP
jgi:hypothetical protein